MKFNEKKELYKLEEIASILRGEKGCAWDKKQTSESLKPYLIEEAYEVYDAIEKENPDDLKEELGDLLFQIYLHAQIAKEEKLFTMDDVAKGISEKLIRRHPHVFGDDQVDCPEEVIQRWEKIKKKEKAHRESILDGVPPHLPALLKAYRVQQKVARIGFDWDSMGDIFVKMNEEIEELREAVESADKERIKDEAGDVLFVLVNILRYIDINPEDVLRQSIDKFMSRFKYIEKKSKERNKELEDMTLAEMDEIWDEAKLVGPASKDG